MKAFIFPTYLAGVAVLSVLPCINAQGSLPVLNKSSTCTEECQQLVPLAIAFEHDSHAHMPLDDFYSIPSNFTPSMKPGSLLRVEIHTNLINYTVPSGLTMSRIMYTSQSLNGTVVPVSAFVLWPYTPFAYRVGKQKNKPHTKQPAPPNFPLVAWAHGTSGQFVDCAPSNYRSLQYHFMTSYSLALEGFAVIATDYAGLGVSTLPNGEQSHAYLAGPAGANDVAFAIEAVRKAFPDQLEEEGPFITMGHSQGGNVAWAFAERQAKMPVPGYLGTIAISPPLRVIDGLNQALQKIATTALSSLPIWASTTLSLQPVYIAAITSVFPSYNFSGMSPISYDRWQNVLKPLQGCTPTYNLAYADVPPNQLANPGWTNNSFVKQWQDQVHVSGRNFKGPLLVIAGSDDVVSLDEISSGVDASCKASGNQNLEMYVYSAMEHFPVIQASRMKWMTWIKDMFTGNSKSDRSCGKKTAVQGFNTNHTIQSITPNWLVDWVPPTDRWELSL